MSPRMRLSRDRGGPLQSYRMIQLWAFLPRLRGRCRARSARRWGSNKLRGVGCSFCDEQARAPPPSVREVARCPAPLRFAGEEKMSDITPDTSCYNVAVTSRRENANLGSGEVM